jgi:hypothetical protein
MSVTITFAGDILDQLIARFAFAERAMQSGALVARVGSDLGYAGFVEGGTRFMAAMPYLAPAAEQGGDELAAAVAAGLAETLETGNLDALDARFRAGVEHIEDLAKHLVRVRTGRLRDSIESEVGR